MQKLSLFEIKGIKVCILKCDPEANIFADKLTERFFKLDGAIGSVSEIRAGKRCGRMGRTKHTPCGFHDPAVYPDPI